MDENDRNDNIFITKNHGGITVENLRDLLKRNDLKKSDVYQSGILTGTAPSYNSYIELSELFFKLFSNSFNFFSYSDFQNMNKYL